MKPMPVFQPHALEKLREIFEAIEALHNEGDPEFLVIEWYLSLIDEGITAVVPANKTGPC